VGKGCEDRFEIAIGSGIHNNELQAQRARNVSTILRQSTVEFRLGFSAFSATAVRLVRRPAVELGGRVWPDGVPYQGWPSAPTFGG
jgi:hypothetical protein